MDEHNTPEPDPNTRVSDNLTTLQPGEHEICTIRRHPIGILGVYGLCGLIATVTAVLAFGLAPTIFSGSSDEQILLAGTLVTVVVAAVCIIFAAIATKVYWGNIWILTTDSLTQVAQLSLFKRQSSQLSLEKIEDVTSEQNGILMQMFNFGVLRIEIPGNRKEFIFPFCPNPNYYATQVLEAREVFDQHIQKEISVKPKSKAYQSDPEIVSYEVPDGPDPDNPA